MPNKVKPGMRFRRKGDEKIFTAMRSATKEVGDGFWFVDATEHLSWPLVNSEFFEPIPEPAPELCAFPGCGRPEDRVVHMCLTETSRCRTATCHDFVAPQAKPVNAGALQNVGSIGPAGDLIPAKPVLREPKPGANGMPDACLKCRGEKPHRNYTCSRCFSDMTPAKWERLMADWSALHPKPAAKDIPSAEPGTQPRHPAGRVTEAARGGEAAITPARPAFIDVPANTPMRMKRSGLTFTTRGSGSYAADIVDPIPASERGPSAVAAAPAIEPWRPSVDDDFWLPDAVEGWRR